jgi:hypothetical protein
MANLPRRWRTWRVQVPSRMRTSNIVRISPGSPRMIAAESSTLQRALRHCQASVETGGAAELLQGRMTAANQHFTRILGMERCAGWRRTHADLVRGHVEASRPAPAPRKPEGNRRRVQTSLCSKCVVMTSRRE